MSLGEHLVYMQGRMTDVSLAFLYIKNCVTLVKPGYLEKLIL